MRDCSNIAAIIADFNAYLTLERGMSANTIQSYNDDVAKLRAFVDMEGVTLDLITRAMVEAFAAGLHDVGVCPRSQARDRKSVV